MSEIKEYNKKLVAIGNMFTQKRKSLGKKYQSRASFINLRSNELFGSSDWISQRYLSSIELGKNWISIEKLLVLADALEIDPIELFAEIVTIYKSTP